MANEQKRVTIKHTNKHTRKKSKNKQKTKNTLKMRTKSRRKRKYKINKNYPTNLVEIVSKILVDNIKTLVRHQSGRMNHLENLKTIDNIPYMYDELKISIVEKYFKKFNVKRKQIKELIYNAVKTCNENDLSLLLKIAGSSREIKSILNSQGTTRGDKVWPVHEENKKMNTLLMICVNTMCRNKEHLIKLLLDYGADANKKNGDGQTALQLEELSWAPPGREKGNPRIKMILSEAMTSRNRRYNMSKVENIIEKTSEPHIYQEHTYLKEIIDKNNLGEEIKGGQCVLIFYMKSCPHCVKLREVIFKLCENSIRVNIMERTKIDDDLKKEYSIDGYPTIYIIKKDGSKELYSGKRSLEDIMSKF